MNIQFSVCTVLCFIELLLCGISTITLTFCTDRWLNTDNKNTNLRTAIENPIRAQHTSSSAHRCVLHAPYYTLQDVTLISSGNWDAGEINSCRTPLCGFCGCHGSKLGNVSTIINLDDRLLTMAGNLGDVGGCCVLYERTIQVQSVFVMSRSRLCSVSHRDPTAAMSNSSEETLTFNIRLDYWDGSLQRANFNLVH